MMRHGHDLEAERQHVGNSRVSTISLGSMFFSLQCARPLGEEALDGAERLQEAADASRS
jgi:hypothetical protein